MKKCTRCLKIKEYDSFYKRNNGYRSECKECLNIRHRNYIKNNPSKRKKATGSDRDRELEAKRKYYQDNKDKYKLKSKMRYQLNREYILERNRQYKALNKDKHLNRIRQRISSGDINLLLRMNLRSRLAMAIKNNQKSGSAIKDLGCSIEELKSYLESKFQPGMTWDNYGLKGWHIDHIRPLSSFDLNDPEQLKIACHYTNLQPLWWYDNLSKGNK